MSATAHIPASVVCIRPRTSCNRDRADQGRSRRIPTDRLHYCVGRALPESPPLDAVIGRYVIVHQADPVTMVRQAATAVRPGGIVAFHEPAIHVKAHTLPTIDTFAKSEQCISSVLAVTLPHDDIGGRLIGCFEEAGLPTPHLLWESIAGDHASPLLHLHAMSYRSLWPHMVRLDLAAADKDDPDTLADRLTDAAATLRAQIVYRPQSCAWAIRPEPAKPT